MVYSSFVALGVKCAIDVQSLLSFYTIYNVANNCRKKIDAIISNLIE